MTLFGGPCTSVCHAEPEATCTQPAGHEGYHTNRGGKHWQILLWSDDGGLASSGRNDDTTGPASALLVIGPGAKELLRVPAGVTAAELREQGFHDVAARLEPAPRRTWLKCNDCSAPAVCLGLFARGPISVPTCAHCCPNNHLLGMCSPLVITEPTP